MRRYSLLPVLTGCFLAAMFVMLTYASPNFVAKPEPPQTLTPLLSLVEYPTIARVEENSYHSFGSIEYFPSSGGNLSFRIDVTASGAGILTTTIGTVSAPITISPECGPSPCTFTANAVVPYTYDPHNGLDIGINSWAGPVLGQGLNINRLVVSIIR